MRPLEPQQKTPEGLQAFTEVAEEWLQRRRNRLADEAVLDAVQRRQERHEGEQRAHTPSDGSDTHATPSTAIVGAACLIKLQGEQPSEKWLLPLNHPVVIGRSGKKTSSLDIDLWPDTAVSRRHALIWFDGEGWCIEDLRSTNGTVMDAGNIRNQRSIRLAPGTKIQFGSTVLMLTALAPESGESAHARDEVPATD
jgi:FHA domain-containing protein